MERREERLFRYIIESSSDLQKHFLGNSFGDSVVCIEHVVYKVVSEPAEAVKVGEFTSSYVLLQ